MKEKEPIDRGVGYPCILVHKLVKESKGMWLLSTSIFIVVLMVDSAGTSSSSFIGILEHALGLDFYVEAHLDPTFYFSLNTSGSPWCHYEKSLEWSDWTN